MKKVTKILNVLLIVMMLVSIAAPVFAIGPDPSGFTGNEATNTQSLQKIGNNVITIVTTAGSIISVIVLVVLGIKYMMGSAEEKAEYKKTLLPYIIGAAFVFAASTIAGVIYNFSSSV